MDFNENYYIYVYVYPPINITSILKKEKKKDCDIPLVHLTEKYSLIQLGLQD